MGRSAYRRCSRSLIAFLPRASKLLFILVLAPWIGLQKTLGADSNPTVSILSSSQAGTTLKVTPGFHPQRAINIKGKTYTFFDGVVAGDGDEGKPLLPSEGILIGIPPTASVSLEISNSSYAVLPSQLIAPTPHNRFDEYMNAHQEYTVDEAAYSRNIWYPSASAELAEVSYLRYQRVVKILVHPYQYNPATQELRKLTALTLNVGFTYPKQQREAESIRPAGADPHFEEVYKSLVVNYDDAKKWRGMQVKNTLQGSPADSTGNWFDPAMPYVRLLIVQDGLYKLTYNDLSSAGVNLTTINPLTFKVYNHGSQVPLFVAGESDGVMDPSDYIEFYAQRNYGKGQYFDIYTDTSAYWLTYGGANGLRMVMEATDTTGTPARSFERTVHLEQDNQYYYGYIDNEIIQPENVPGEGWYWSNFYPGTATGFNFAVQNVVASAETNAVLRVRFNGMSQHSATPDHIAKVTLNGTELGQVGFDFTSDTVFAISFPSTLLKEGANTLTVQSLATQALVNEFYLDWFEVSYQCAFKAISDQLSFTSQGSGGSAQTQYTITNFQSSAIDVYNLTDRKKFTNARIAPGLDAGVAITFHDTASVNKQYLLVADDQKLKPAGMELKQFKDIRNNPSGADYIIITHRLFKESADQLANYRASQMGVRAVVVDVQDIYDEFNYGVFNPEAIKLFLRYTYDQWAPPAPAYVLLFGDASWDFKFHMANSVKQNFVPAYGNPSTDDWFVAFDSTSSVLPSMLIGRIPAENPTEAEQAVEKLMKYDQTAIGDWVKDFLFITGGNDDAEKSSFNGQAEYLITNHVLPAPVGGFPYRVYKKTDAIIDGENKQLIQDIISNGTVFLNFIGHSGGRIWGVDAGSPDDLRNTGGQFVFVTSVSCNVGAFATPAANVLTEDWLFANGRAAIACWAAASLGYPDIGFTLTNSFLRSVTRDTARGLGELTTTARIDLWKSSPSSPRVNAAVQLHPLLGDPIGLLAVPTKPDLAITQNDVSFDPIVPTETDSLVKVKANVKNYGLVPGDSISVNSTDTFAGLAAPISTYRLPPVFLRDSLAVIWNAARKPGNHIITLQIDPSNQINEVTKVNNKVDVPIEVVPSLVVPIRPAASSIVPRGQQTLEVAVASSAASRSLKYFFEVDTSSEFTSSAKMVSPAIDAGILTTQWTTTPLTIDGSYYWRSRIFDGRDSGAWATSSFVVSGVPPPAGVIRWTEADARQFLREQRFQADVTDSGVTIAKAGGVPIYVRSLGYRNDADKDYYSVIKVVDQTMTGYWWVVGNGFVVASVNEIDGSFEYRNFDVSSDATLADSMAQYLRGISADRFIVITVVYDGYTNDNETLYSTLEGLGARQIRSVRPGESWAFIGQKRTGIALESYSTDAVAEINYLIPSFYNFQVGSIATGAIGPARRWQSVSWTNDASGAGTDVSLDVVGVRSTGELDTLMVLPKNVLSADLSAIDTKTYPMLSLVSSLRSTFGTATPVLKSWSVEYEGLPDPAIAPELVRLSQDSVLEGQTVECSADIQNIAYTTVDSVKVNFYLLDQGNVRRLFQSSEVYNVEPEKSKTVSAMLNSAGLHGLQSIVVELDSKPLVELYDLNDVATRTFYVRHDTVGVVTSLVAPIRPAASSVVARGQQTLEVTFGSSTASRSFKYFFEVDTSSEFNSSAKMASPAIDAGILTTQWITSPLTIDGSYYWRSRIFDGRDSGAWATSSFVVSGVPPPAGVIHWTEANARQFLRDQRFQADVTDSGVTIAKAGGIPIYVRSLGYRNDADKDYYSVIKIIDQTVFGLWWVVGNGFVVASVNEIDGSFEYRNFDVSSDATLADSMAQYLHGIPADRFIVITVVYDGYTNDNETLYSSLEGLGARQIRSVRPGESWAFIGQKRTGIALESYSTDAVAEMNYLIPSIYGLQAGKIVTGNIGVARRWRSVSWTNDASGAGTDISLDVVGVKSTGGLDTLMVLPKGVLSADLSAIDTKTYPMLSLVGSLRSTFGTATPVLKSWSVEYEGLPDPAVAPELVRLSQDSVLEGQTVECSADIQNIGYTTVDSVKVNFYYLLDQSTVRKLFQSSEVYNVEPEKSKTVSATLNSTGLHGLQSIVVELDSKPLVELYDLNDIATRTFYLQHDTIPPELQVTFDGISILSGDYVSAKPNILVKLFDNSPLPIQDTSNVSLRLDNLRVPYVNNPQLTYSLPSTGSEKVELQYEPQLTDGGHSLFIDAQDASGNPLSGSGYRVDFSVRNAPTLQDVYNYPNPFSNDTYFTFNLTGSTPPDELKIRIYTVAGRLIHTLLVPVSSLHFGFNRFPWDGRDHDGNEIANGVYFYTMVLRSGDKTFNVTERLAKVR